MVRSVTLPRSHALILTWDTISKGVEFGGNPSNRADGFITWVAAGTPSAGMTAAAAGPDTSLNVGQRLVSEEPMTLDLNLCLSSALQDLLL